MKHGANPLGTPLVQPVFRINLGSQGPYLPISATEGPAVSQAITPQNASHYRAMMRDNLAFDFLSNQYETGQGLSFHQLKARIEYSGQYTILEMHMHDTLSVSQSIMFEPESSVLVSKTTHLNLPLLQATSNPDEVSETDIYRRHGIMVAHQFLASLLFYLKLQSVDSKSFLTEDNLREILIDTGVFNQQGLFNGNNVKAMTELGIKTFNPFSLSPTIFSDPRFDDVTIGLDNWLDPQDTPQLVIKHFHDFTSPHSTPEVPQGLRELILSLIRIYLGHDSIFVSG